MARRALSDVPNGKRDEEQRVQSHLEKDSVRVCWGYVGTTYTWDSRNKAIFSRWLVTVWDVANCHVTDPIQHGSSRDRIHHWWMHLRWSGSKYHQISCEM
jgi:hypothetical protein